MLVKYGILKLLCILLINFSVSSQDTNLNNEIIDKTLKKYNTTKSFTYQTNIKYKSFDNDSFIDINANVCLIVNEIDSNFKCFFYYSANYIGTNKTFSKYYDGKRLIVIDQMEKQYTIFNPNNNQISPINGTYDGVIVQLSYIFNPQVMRKVLLDTSQNISLVDTIVNGIPYLAQINLLPNTPDYTDNRRIIFINKNNNLIERVYGESHYKDQVQIENYEFYNVQLKEFNLQFLESLFKNKVNSEYSEKNYEPPQRDTLILGTKLVPFNGKLYPNNNDIRIDTSLGIVILDFWYTSCLPCIKAIPDLNKIYSKYKKQIRMYGINPSPDDIKDLSKIDNFQKRITILYPIVLAEWDDLIDYKIISFPTLYIFDKNGNLVFNQIGISSEENLFEKLDSVLKKILQ